MHYTVDKLIEALIDLCGKKFEDEIRFLKPNLLIKHKKAGVKYTIAKVVLDDTNSPYVLCYRYYDPQKKKKKIYIKINKKNFNKYEAV